jgi:hypothetical protein
LIGHRCERAAAGGALALIGGQLVPNLHDRQGGLLPRPVSWVRTTRHRCARRRADGALKNLVPGVLEIVLEAEGQLLDLGNPTQSRQLRGQLKVLRNQTLIFAIEEDTDLAKRLDVLFISELHHSDRHLIIGIDRMQVKKW